MDKTETKQAWEYNGTPRTLTWMNRSPISGKWQIPAGVTTTKPPKAKEGYTLTFDGEKWTQTKEEPKEAPKPPEPTKEEKLAQLDYDYQSQKQELINQYTDDMLHGDTDAMESDKQAMVDLDTWYDEEYKKIEGGEE